MCCVTETKCLLRGTCGIFKKERWPSQHVRSDCQSHRELECDLVSKERKFYEYIKFKVNYFSYIVHTGEFHFVLYLQL